jgi:hypothetical protein
MAFAVNDRVKETSTTTGTSTLTLDGAVPGFETFSSAIGNTNTTYYAIQNQSVPTEFEVGIGTVGAGTLSRDTIISSSNSDAAVNFSAGTKDVFVTLPASKAVLENDSGVASATTFSGSGAQLTNLNADNLTSGTVPDARFPATLPAISGANLTNLDASDLASGTVPDARFPATLPAISGANLTNLDASDLASGTVPIARIDLNLLTTSTSDGDGDFFVVVDSVGAEKKLTKANINISGFNNDAGYGTGDITAVTAGNGLTGGGTTGAVTLDVGAGTGIDVAADAISVDVSDFMTNGSNNRVITATGTDAMNAETNLTFDGSTLTVTGTASATTFSGSGASLTSLNASNLSSGTVPIARIDLNLLTTSTADGDGDFFVVVDSVGAEKKLTKANINISGFNNNSGFTTNTGTVTSVGVTAGSGLTGGGTVTTSGTITLNVGAGTGIDVAADAISVDVSDFMTNGVNNRVLTATGADAMNAEANMTFDGSTLAVTGAITATGDITAFLHF